MKLPHRVELKIPAFTFRMPVLKCDMPLSKLRTPMQWVAISLFFAYLLLCAIAFYAVVQPNLDGQSLIRLGADSDTYWQVADFVRGEGVNLALIGLGANYLGPVAIALTLKTGSMVALFNAFLFCVSIYAAGRIPGVNQWTLAILLMLNAETLVGIVTLNKEILSLFSAVLFAYYVYSHKKSKLLLLIILLSAIGARWQQAALVLLFLFFKRKNSFFSKRPKTALALIVLLLTVTYPLAASKLDLSGFTDQGDTGGTITVLNGLQAKFLYPVALLPKVIMSLFGRLLTPSYYFGEYWKGDFNDWQNQYAGHLHTVALLLICAIAAVRKRLSLQEPLIFFCAMYLVVTSIAPFIQNRYQFPVYVLLCIEIVRNRERTSPPALLEVPDRY